MEAVLLGIAGGVILICFAIMGYFLKRVDEEIREQNRAIAKNSEESGRNKGRINILKTEVGGSIELLERTIMSEIKLVRKDIEYLIEISKNDD